MSGKICQICGAPAGIYPLCPKCFKLRDNGLVEKNFLTGQWERVDYDEEDEFEEEFENQSIEYENESEICCVCGDAAPYGKQCQNCYYETLDYKDNIDKNRKASELREWYYNLKNSIFRQNNYEIKQSNCNKLVAIAILCRDIHGDDSLISRVYSDIDKLLDCKEQKTIEAEDDKELEYDSHKNDTSGQVKCVDGHWVENDLEREIDDILYSLRKVHVYAKKVNEITERCVKSDWFIPVLSDTKGIYIEFWGMDTEEYKKNKEEKVKLYQQEELQLIQIYRKDVLSDKALLKDNLESEINKIEKELRKRR